MNPVVEQHVLRGAKVEWDTYLTEYGLLRVTPKRWAVIRFISMENTHGWAGGPVKEFDLITRPLKKMLACEIVDHLHVERDAKQQKNQKRK